MPTESAEPTTVLVHEDRHVVVACKPPGVDVHGRGPEDAGTLIAMVAETLRVSPRRLHPASRLDRPVSGLVPIARSRIGRKALTEQYQRRLVHRAYLALVSAPPDPPSGEWDRPVGPAPGDRRRQAVDAPGGRPARTLYRTARGLAADAALVELEPRTGRTHQLRVHLAAAGCPVLGDRRYGGPVRLTLPSGKVLSAGRVMLHAARLSWLDPETGERRDVEAPMPPDMAALVEALSL